MYVCLLGVTGTFTQRLFSARALLIYVCCLSKVPRSQLCQQSYTVKGTPLPLTYPRARRASERVRAQRAAPGRGGGGAPGRRRRAARPAYTYGPARRARGPAPRDPAGSSGAPPGPAAESLKREAFLYILLFLGSSSVHYLHIMLHMYMIHATPQRDGRSSSTAAFIPVPALCSQQRACAPSAYISCHVCAVMGMCSSSLSSSSASPSPAASAAGGSL